jgi:hypothetical protein
VRDAPRAAQAVAVRDDAVPGRARARGGLCIDEGALSFITEICCPYMNFPYKFL